jgi:hypothetical protein
MSEVKSYQRNLNDDREAKQHFVEAEDNDETDASSEEEEHVKIVAPRRKKKSTIDAMLLSQSISLQQDCLKAQKTIYKLRSEIDTEDVKTRYLKLDLNNLQVKLDEELVKNKVLFRTQVENWAMRLFILFYILWSIFSIRLF